MNHFDSPGKYRLEVAGALMLIEAWSLMYDQHYFPEITQKADSEFVIEVDVTSKTDLDEIINSLYSMFLKTVRIEFSESNIEKLKNQMI